MASPDLRSDLETALDAPRPLRQASLVTHDPSEVPELAFVGAAESLAFSPEPGLRRRILANNAKMMLVEHRMEEGWAGARHRHPHDQLVYVQSGHLKFGCGDQTFEVFAGDSFVIEGNVEHQAWALSPSVVLDVFTPTREDYLPQAP